MLRHISTTTLLSVVLAGGLACSSATDESPEDSSPPSPSPGSGKEDSTTRETDIQGNISFGEKLRAQYAGEEYVGYTFEVSGEATIDAEVVSDRADPSIWLYGPQESDGEWGWDIEENDDIDWPDNKNAAIEDVELDEAGRYLLVTAPEGFGGGSYTLRVDCSGPGCEANGGGGGSSASCRGDLSHVRKVPVGRAGSFIHGSQSGKDLEVVGQTAYMANMQKGVCRFDVSDPTSARLQNCIAPPSDGASSHRVHDIEVDGDTLYVLNSLEGLWVYDISQPDSPRAVGRFADAEYFGLDMALDGDHLYLAARRSGMHVLDVSSPEHPEQIGYMGDTGAPSTSSESASYETIEVEISGDTAYLAQRQGGLGIYDVSRPAEPRELGRYRPERAEDADHRPSIMAVDIDGGQAFLAAANGTSNLHVLDVRDPAAPELLSTDDASPERRYWVQETISVSQDYVALSRGKDRGLMVFERTESGAGAHVGTVEPDGEPIDVHLTDDGLVLYAAAANTLRNSRSHLMGLGVVDVACD